MHVLLTTSSLTRARTEKQLACMAYGVRVCDRPCLVVRPRRGYMYYKKSTSIVLTIVVVIHYNNIMELVHVSVDSDSARADLRVDVDRT